MNLFVFIAIALVVIAIIFELIERIAKLSMRSFFIVIFAAFVGLVMGALLTIPLSALPGKIGEWLPLTVTILLVFGFITFFWREKKILDRWFDFANRFFSSIKIPGIQSSPIAEVVIDTSVLIDGRVLDIAESGFLNYKLFVPRFVLKELQNIADSSDSDKRARGRRGLDIVDKLKKRKGIRTEICVEDFRDINDVDSKLILLSKKKSWGLLTTDYNLNKTAKAENIRVLNINDLSQRLRPVILPGEEMELKVIHQGKEKTQGVGYLPDGTMIVVEKGYSQINKTVKVRITRVLQTSAGKMFFSQIITK